MENFEQIRQRIKDKEKEYLNQEKQNSSIKKQLKKIEEIEKIYNKEKKKFLDLVERQENKANKKNDNKGE